ncbi:MAG: PAS domain-containing protein, partial [Candidatus Heimdallarchaeota archaeon]
KEDAQRIEKEVMPKLMKEGLVRDIETIAIRRDGTKFPVLMNWTLVKDAEGKSTGIITVARDITELKRAERVLRESEEKFRLAFENAMDAIFWADPKTGLITNCNKAAEILLEKKREEIVGCHQTTVHPPQKAEYYANMFKKHIEREGAVDEEAEVITKSGKIKPVHITASVTLVGGKPIIQGIFRDITERKRAEEERLKAAANERRVNELEKFARVAVGRELKMVELKKRIKELESKLKEITGKG